MYVLICVDKCHLLWNLLKDSPLWCKTDFSRVLNQPDILAPGLSFPTIYAHLILIYAFYDKALFIYASILLHRSEKSVC